jgi:hypothetical protein
VTKKLRLVAREREGSKLSVLLGTTLRRNHMARALTLALAIGLLCVASGRLTAPTATALLSRRLVAQHHPTAATACCSCVAYLTEDYPKDPAPAHHNCRVGHCSAKVELNNWCWDDAPLTEPAGYGRAWGGSCKNVEGFPDCGAAKRQERPDVKAGAYGDDDDDHETTMAPTPSPTKAVGDKLAAELLGESNEPSAAEKAKAEAATLEAKEKKVKKSALPTKESGAGAAESEFDGKKVTGFDHASKSAWQRTQEATNAPKKVRTTRAPTRKFLSLKILHRLRKEHFARVKKAKRAAAKRAAAKQAAPPAKIHAGASPDDDNWVGGCVIRASLLAARSLRHLPVIPSIALTLPSPFSPPTQPHWGLQLSYSRAPHSPAPHSCAPHADPRPGSRARGGGGGGAVAWLARAHTP